MKKVIVIFLFIIATFSMGFAPQQPIPAFANTLPDRVLRFGIGDTFYNFNGENFEIRLFGEKTDSVATYIDPYHNRAMIYVGMLLDAFDAWPEWACGRVFTLNRRDGAVTLEREVVLPDGLGMATNENTPQNLWFIPLRYVAYAFNAEVTWDEENQAVYIRMDW